MQEMLMVLPQAEESHYVESCYYYFHLRAVNHSSVFRKHNGYAQSKYVNHNVDIHMNAKMNIGQPRVIVCKSNV